MCIHAGALAHKRASMQGEAHSHTFAHTHTFAQSIRSHSSDLTAHSDHVLTKWLRESNLNCTVCSHDHHVTSLVCEEIFTEILTGLLNQTTCTTDVPDELFNRLQSGEKYEYIRPVQNEPSISKKDEHTVYHTYNAVP